MNKNVLEYSYLFYYIYFSFVILLVIKRPLNCTYIAFDSQWIKHQVLHRSVLMTSRLKSPFTYMQAKNVH